MKLTFGFKMIVFTVVLIGLIFGWFFFAEKYLAKSSELAPAVVTAISTPPLPSQSVIVEVQSVAEVLCAKFGGLKEKRWESKTGYPTYVDYTIGVKCKDGSMITRSWENDY